MVIATEEKTVTFLKKNNHLIFRFLEHSAQK